MRRALLLLTALLTLSAWTTRARAQTGVGIDDPFFLYYSYFLPRQAALAAQPNINDTINANVAARQSYAATNRSSLYDPNGSYGAFDNYDPNALFGRGGGGPGAVRGGRQAGSIAGRGFPSGNASGQGPALYYNRVAQYHPSIRSGQSANKNLFVPGRGMRGGSGRSMSAASMMPNAMSGMGSIGPR